jgi:hypothetical protein
MGSLPRPHTHFNSRVSSIDSLGIDRVQTLHSIPGIEDYEVLNEERYLYIPLVKGQIP